MTDTTAAPHPAPTIQNLTQADIRASLAEGWRDFRAAPAFGLFFSAFYVLGGILIFLQVGVISQSWWLVPIVVGFPLLGPFIAVGLYEVSRRLEAGAPLNWAEVLGVVLNEKDRQIPYMAVIAFMILTLWLFIAHVIFALFFGLKAMTHINQSLGVFYSAEGVMMALVGGAIGGAIALLLFSITVIGMPMLLDREVDIVTAMIHSVSTVRKNPRSMLTWGVIVGAALIIAMIPLFLGLFIVLPVLGHATWRLYRRAISFPD